MATAQPDDDEDNNESNDGISSASGSSDVPTDVEAYLATGQTVGLFDADFNDTPEATREAIENLLRDKACENAKPEGFWWRLRYELYQFFENPQASRVALCFNIYFMVLILFSTLTFCLQSLLSLTSTQAQLLDWSYMEAFVVSQFTADYLIRIFCCPKFLPFIIAPFNIVDLIAILPFWIDVIIVSIAGSKAGVSKLAVVRVLRLARVLRMFKLGKGNLQLQLVATAMRRSRDGIMLLIFLFMMASVVFSSGVYYSETSYCEYVNGTWYYGNDTTIFPSYQGTRSAFQSIFTSMWWCITTLTTVGYGDTFPVTPPGKAVGVVTMLSGLLVVAFPVTIIGSNLTDVYEEFKLARIERKRLKMLRKKAKKALRAAKTTSASSDTDLLDSEHAERLRLILAETDNATARRIGDELSIALAEVDSATMIIKEQASRLESARLRLETLSEELTYLAEKRKKVILAAHDSGPTVRLPSPTAAATTSSAIGSTSKP